MELCHVLSCCVFFTSVLSYTVQPCLESYYSDDEKRYAVQAAGPQPRGYYNSVGYSFISGLEPLNLLAGLAFLAFLMQTMHAMYNNQSLLGNLLNAVGNIIPLKQRSMDVNFDDSNEILKAIHLQDYYKQKKRKRNKTDREKNKTYFMESRLGR